MTTDLMPAIVPAVAGDVTPEQATRWLLSLGRQLRDAAADVEVARTAELEATAAYDKARRAAILSPDCPKVRRDGWTVAERDAWIEDQVEAQKFNADVCKAAREAAERLVKTTGEQVHIIQTIAGLVKAELFGGVR